MSKVQQAITSQKNRVIATVPFQENQVIPIKMPTDTTIVRLMFRLTGAVQTTFASGTPVAKAESIFDSLVNRIDVTVDGGDTIKSVRPHMLHLQNLLANRVQPERFASAAAAASANPTTQGPFVFGTTTQYTSVRETVVLPFEQVFCEPGMGRENTYLNLKNHSSCEIKLVTSSFSNLLGTGNTAPVVFANNTLQIEVIAIERPDIPEGIKFDIWKQFMRTSPIAGEVRDLPVDLLTSNYLTDILVFCQDGAAGSATTATGKLASNLLLKELRLKHDGRNDIQQWNFLSLQNDNRSTYGVVADTSGGVSRLDGCGHLNLLSRRDLSTALPGFRPITNNLQLFLTSNPSGTVDYTSGAQAQLLVGELIKQM